MADYGVPPNPPYVISLLVAPKRCIRAKLVREVCFAQAASCVLLAHRLHRTVHYL